MNFNAFVLDDYCVNVKCLFKEENSFLTQNLVPDLGDLGYRKVQKMVTSREQKRFEMSEKMLLMEKNSIFISGILIVCQRIISIPY